MIKKILSLAFISVFFIMNFSQIVEGSSYVPKYFSSIPNVASLGTYGGVPVNMSTGQPNINIDLFENEDIPISLSYNLSSIKPDYPISWTGLGWGLNIGGAVSRIVKGGVDEVYVDYSDPDAFSYYYKYNTLNSTNWFSDSKMTYYFKGLTPLFPEYFLAYPAPDEFTFSVNGINGSFFKNHEGKWIIKSNQEIDFKVTDEIKYDFTFCRLAFH